MRYRVLSRAALVVALITSLAVPSLAGAATRTDNKLPGVSLPNSPAKGRVSVSDPWDIYRVSLAKNQKIVISVSGSGGPKYAFLLPPGARKIGPAGAVALSWQTTSNHHPQVIRYGATAATAGTYSLVVFGSGNYTVGWSRTGAQYDDDAPGIGISRFESTTTPGVYSISNALHSGTDWSDVFAARLETGQAMCAQLSGPSTADFDLALFSDYKTVYYRASSGSVQPWPYNARRISTGGRGVYPERVMFDAPATGTYYLQASAFTGSGSYDLTATVLPATAIEDVSWSKTSPMIAGETVSVSGRLLDSAGDPLAGEPVYLMGKRGGTWVPVAGPVAAGADGSFSLSKKMLRNGTLMVRYRGKFNTTAPASSAPMRFGVKARVSAPVPPAAVNKSRAFRVYGSLYPAHASGSRAVTLTFQRWEKSRWVTRLVRRVKTSRSGDLSTYRAAISLPYYGRWRVRAYHADAGHVKSGSGFDTILVK